MTNSTMSNFMRVLPVASQDEFNALVEAAKKDNHSVINPTDVIWKGGERVGFISIGALPTVWAWLSTNKFTPRNTVEIFNYMEGVSRRISKGVYVPVPKDSPMHPFMEKLGYVNGGNYDFFFKAF